uniref:helix-turn-helix domain-containing protein n=1 Tax=Eubacterium sp. TaxID=142586 RepID=UPI004027557B
MVDSKRLMGIIISKGYSQSTLAEKVGMSKNALNLKINNKSDFRTGEIENLCRILGIKKAQDKVDIFLFKSSQN